MSEKTKPTVPTLSTKDRGFAASLARLRATQEEDTARAEQAAAAIVGKVRRRGDAAVIEYAKKFDGIELTPRRMLVSERELDDSVASLPPKIVSALRKAARRIKAFHREQKQGSWSYRDADGLTLGQQISPLRRVGVYVPGGKGAYPSSVLMNIVPARVAGVDEVVMVSPAGPEGHPPAVLAAARIAGVDAVYRVGGAQAVAALAYGTKTIPRVDKIVGPGNAYVQAAKRQVYGQVDIDATAGPSEVLVVADTSARADFVAADLLAQAEHGSGDECAILLTPSKRLAAAVEQEIDRQLPALPRRRDIARVLKRRGALIVVRNLDEAVDIAEEIAPEHLELHVRNATSVARRLRNSGAVFCGDQAPAPLGDYMAGPNHVLPTGGSARFFSPLGVYDFVKRTSVVSATRAAIEKLGPAVETLAELEGYDAHARAIRMRRSG